MQGYQLTFFIAQDRRVGHQAMGEWLLAFCKNHGALGGSLVGAAEGFDHAGRFHSAHFFELADQPLAVTVSVTRPPAGGCWMRWRRRTSA